MARVLGVKYMAVKNVENNVCESEGGCTLGSLEIRKLLSCSYI